MSRENWWWLMILAAAVTISGFGGWEVYQTYSHPAVNGGGQAEGEFAFSAQSWAGQPVSFGDFSGRVLLVNFWASWCSPCAREFPSMLRLLDRYPATLAMIAFSADHKKEEVGRFLEAFDVRRPNLVVVWDPANRVSSQYRVSALPETLVFAPNGKLLFRAVGSRDWLKPGALESAESFLNP